MTYTVFILTLNEIEGIQEILPRVEKLNPDQILVSDGQSTDGTIEWLRNRGTEVYVQKKKGIRHAYIEAWPLIRGDIVVTISPDGNCIPEDIPLLLEKMTEGYDMVIASRYKDGLKSEDDDAITAFGNWLFTSLINCLHGGKYSDAMTIYRAYKTSLFHELGLHLERSYDLPERLFFTKIGCEPLLSIRAAKQGKRIAEIPSLEPARLGGTRKLQVIRWGLAYMFQVFSEKFKSRI